VARSPSPALSFFFSHLILFTCDDFYGTLLDLISDRCFHLVLDSFPSLLLVCRTGSPRISCFFFLAKPHSPFRPSFCTTICSDQVLCFLRASIDIFGVVCPLLVPLPSFPSPNPDLPADVLFFSLAPPGPVSSAVRP